MHLKLIFELYRMPDGTILQESAAADNLGIEWRIFDLGVLKMEKEKLKFVFGRRIE